MDRLHALEVGDDVPTRAMLSKMARQYRRPLAALYLPKPPPKGRRAHDLRSPATNRSTADDARLDALIRDAKTRQALLKSAMLDVDEAKALPFVGSVHMDDGASAVLASIRQTLRMPLDEYRQASSIDEAFRRLRGRVEAAGIFVVLLGDLGSHHTRFEADLFRGLCLADHMLPFVVLNPNDHRSAWPLTLLHELAHLWLGQTGVSGGLPERSVEKFCNRVASEYLLPSEELSASDLPVQGSSCDLTDSVAEYARDRHVSGSMVAYRLHLQGALDRETWLKLARHYAKAWRRGDEQARQRETAVNYYVVRKHRLGTRLVETTSRLLAAEALTTTKAARILGTSPKVAHRVCDH